MTDNVSRPPHYAEGWSNGAEVIDITENLNFNRGNAIKYIARAGKKNADTEIEDLKKARWYVEREIDRLERTSGQLPLFDVPEQDQAFVEHMDQPQQPRVWERIVDIPLSVRFKDGDGDYWFYDGESWRWSSSPDGVGVKPSGRLDNDDYQGPFTEVIE